MCIDIPSSFLLCASTSQQHGPGPVETEESFETFFRKGPRLFQVTSPKDSESTCSQTLQDFIHDFQHAQTLVRRYGKLSWDKKNISNLYVNDVDG